MRTGRSAAASGTGLIAALEVRPVRLGELARGTVACGSEGGCEGSRTLSAMLRGRLCQKPRKAASDYRRRLQLRTRYSRRFRVRSGMRSRIHETADAHAGLVAGDRRHQIE